MRHVRPGSIQDAVTSAYATAGGLECVANDIGVSTTLLSRAVDANDEQRPGGLGINYLHRLSRIVPEAAAPIAEHFAKLAGGRFVPSRSEMGAECLVQHGIVVSKESGEAISKLLEAAQNPDKRPDAIKELLDLEHAARSARLRLEADE